MNMQRHLNLGSILAFTTLFYVVYYVLLHDNSLHLSIGYIIAHSHQLEVKQHLIILGLLPIYIAAMIFGAAMLGNYIGSSLQDLFSRTSRSK